MLYSFDCFLKLYQFSRHLAFYKAESVLSAFPYSFILCRPAKETLPGLPDSPEKRLELALSSTTPALVSFTRFLGAYPEITGKETADILSGLKYQEDAGQDNPLEIRFLPAAASKEFIDLLSVLYWLARKSDKKSKQKTAVSFIEAFERMNAAETDLRFEAAAMERFKDSFFEDELLFVPQIDWIKTSQYALYTEESPAPIGLETGSRKETIGKFVKILTLMILRDGFFTLPEKENWERMEDGRLYMKKCPVSIALSMPERRFISSMLDAFDSKNYAQAAKALFKAGFLPPVHSLLELSRLCQDCAESSKHLETAAKTGFILHRLEQEGGVSFPPALHMLQNALYRLEHLSRGLNCDIPWEDAYEDYRSFMRDGLRLPRENAQDFLKSSLIPPEMHALSQSVRRKEMTGFIKDPRQIPEMIKRAEAGYRFRTPGMKINWKIIVPLLILAGVFWIRFF